MSGLPTLHLLPQSHIDVVWLWRYDPETIHRCCKPTFERALSNLRRFPEYTFAQSQVPLYEPMKRLYPEIFDEIKEMVLAGRWEIVGGMYVEAEGGEPSGESLVRQCVMGKRYFREEFGVDVRTAWQPDAWSHPWQLPQILRKSGIDSYLFFRGDVGEKLFWWQAPDGSRVLAVTRFAHPDAYDYLQSGEAVFAEWKENLRSVADRYQVNDFPIVVGGGDHGGGLDARQIEKIVEFMGEPGEGISVGFGTFSGFVDSLKAGNPRLPTVAGELGLQLHGDLTNVGEIKKSNRECENLLVTAEKWATVALATCGLEYPGSELEEAWKKLLFNQFHDVLGGSLIPPAIEDAMGLFRGIRESCSVILKNSLDALVEKVDTRGRGIPVAVFNPLAWNRTDVAEVELERAEESGNLSVLETGDPVQIVGELEEADPPRVRCLFVARDVPSLGYRTHHLVSGVSDETQTSRLIARETVLENEFLRVEVDPATGCLDSLIDKRSHRELLDPSGKGNLLVAIEDEGDSEGRFVRDNDTVGKPPGRVWEILSEPRISLVEEGPLRAKIRVERTFENSIFKQDVSLCAGLPRVDFDLEIDWHDVHWMIKVAFPFALQNPEITCEAPYGTIVRPGDGIEYPAQKWVDLSSDGHGISLLNDSRYAHDVQGSTIRLSVLRSPTEPAWNTDEGLHTIGYSLFPHAGSWKEAGVMRQGYGFNNSLIPIVATDHEGGWESKGSFFSVEPENVVLEVVKRAFDSGHLILRLFETHGRNSEAYVRLPFAVSRASETDLLENELEEIAASGSTVVCPIGAYEIKTLKVEAVGSPPPKTTRSPVPR